MKCVGVESPQREGPQEGSPVPDIELEKSSYLSAMRSASLHRMERQDGRARCGACQQRWPCEAATHARTVMRQWRESSE